jgi:RNA polymerase sigma-70 factor (ECF subfamily)
MARLSTPHGRSGRTARYDGAVSDAWPAFAAAFERRPAVSPDELRACIATAAAAWPDFVAAQADVAAAIGNLLSATNADALPSAETAAALYLAVACACGDSGAIAAFEARYFEGVRATLASVVTDRSEIDDLEQRLRTRLFVAEPGGRARAVEAVGHGDLGSFVRVAALRLALNDRRGAERRRSRADAFGRDALRLHAAADTPELTLLRHTHRARFKEAFEHAIGRLGARERNLLRYHLAEHLGIDELAKIHGVHRSTAARWLAAARSQVAEYTKERLADLIDDANALPALFSLIHSHLDLSITRVFVGESTTST